MKIKDTTTSKGTKPPPPPRPINDIPDPWNPRLTFAPDTVSGKWRVEINFGMGFPWIACKMADPFRVVDSGPVFESYELAVEAGEFALSAVAVLIHDFSTKGN